jgi:hypothetical protein
MDPPAVCKAIDSSYCAYEAVSVEGDAGVEVVHVVVVLADERDRQVDAVIGIEQA